MSLPWEEDYAPIISTVDKAAEDAIRTVSPEDAEAIKEVAKAAIESVLDELVAKTSAAIPNPPEKSDFTKADARSRALQTLVVGMSLSAVAGLITAVGDVANAAWAHSPLTATSVVTLLAGSAATAAINYLTRMTHEPVHTASLCEHTPGGPPYPRKK